MNEKQAQIELSKIRKDIEKNEKEYKLSEKEKHDAYIVLNTLDYIVKALVDKTPLYCKCFFFKGKDENTHAPIHLENYALKENNNEDEPMGDVSKQYLLGSLVKEFIECYQISKQKGKVKDFCSRLYGFCIDARTRSAFEYVRKDQDSPTFTDLLKNNIQKLSVDNKNLYFHAFAEILKNSWGQPFLADEGQNGLSKIKGVINTDQFDLIKQSLEILGYEPANDFLTAYDVLKDEKNQHLLPVYIKFLLSHKNLLDEMGLSKQGIEKESKDHKPATPVVRGLYNRMIMDLIPVMSKTIKDNPKNYGLDEKEFRLFIDFLERASPATCFRILSFIPIHERPEKRRIEYVELLFRKLMWTKAQDTDEYKDFIKIKFGGKYNLYQLLELSKLEKERAETSELFREEKPSHVASKEQDKEQFINAIKEVNLPLAKELILKSKIDNMAAQAIISDAMTKVQDPDIFFELYALTTETHFSNQAKESNLFDHSIQDLSIDKRLYFYALVEIMKNSWGSEITIEGRKICLNSDQLPIIMDYLGKKGYLPQNDFLTAYTGLKSNHIHLLHIYIKLILLHPGLLDAEGFSRLGMESPEQERVYKKIASPVERMLYNCMIKDLVPVIMKAIQENSKSASLSKDDFKLFYDLVSRATPGTCFEILSVIPIHTRPPEKKIPLLNLLFMKFKYFIKENPESGEELLRVKFGGKYTLTELAAGCNLTDICNEIFLLAVNQNQAERIKAMLDNPKININSALLLAVKDKNIHPAMFELLLKHKNVDINYIKDEESLFSAALEHDASLQKLKLIIQHKDLNLKDSYQLFKKTVQEDAPNHKEIEGYFIVSKALNSPPHVSALSHSIYRVPTSAPMNSDMKEHKNKDCKIS